MAQSKSTSRKAAASAKNETPESPEVAEIPQHGAEIAPGVTAYRAGPREDASSEPEVPDAENDPYVMVLNRDYTLTTKMGHVIGFRKGEPIRVPPVVYQEALGVGAVPADGSDPSVTDPEPAKGAPTDPLQRFDAIAEAMEGITKHGDRLDFTAAGHPHEKAVTRALGWRVDQREIAEVDRKLRQMEALSRGNA